MLTRSTVVIKKKVKRKTSMDRLNSYREREKKNKLEDRPKDSIHDGSAEKKGDGSIETQDGDTER